jgi:hypothetical protein
MFNIAYGLGCDSKDDLTLIRLEKLVTAVTQSGLPSQFLVVSILFRYTHETSLNFAIY